MVGGRLGGNFLGESRGAQPLSAEPKVTSGARGARPEGGRAAPGSGGFCGVAGEDGRRWDGREGLREGQGGGGRTAAGRPPGGRASGPEGRFGGAERRRACGLILRAVQVTECNNYAGLDFAGGFGGAVEKGKYGRNG